VYDGYPYGGYPVCEEYIGEGYGYDPNGGGHIDPCAYGYGYATGGADAYDLVECTGG
jgi:hypothetical protein